MKLKAYRTILLIVYCNVFGAANAQNIERFNSFSYNVNEGLLQSTIGDIAFDKNNFCWLSFPNGIQRFDGKNFINVPVQAGLPDDKLAFFFQHNNGDLFISHSRGISKYEISDNRFVQVYTSPSDERTASLFIGEDEGIIYFYSETGKITGINDKTFKKVSEAETGFPDYSSNSDYRPRISDNIINHKVALIINSSLYLWNLKKGKLLYESAPVASISVFLLKLKNENEVLYYNYKQANALQLYNFSSGANRALVIESKGEEHTSRCIIYSWRNKTLLSFNNRLYETDSTLQRLTTELVNFQNQPFPGNLSIARMREDNFGNLYFVTVTGGIRKVIRHNYPVKYYSTGKEGENFVIAVLPDKTNNRILAGTSGNGLLVYDTQQHLIKHIKGLPGRTLPIAVNAIVKDNKGSYLLFVSGEERIWRLSKDLLRLSSIPISTTLPQHKSGISYFAHIISQDEKEVIVQSQSKLYRINLTANTVHEHHIIDGYVMGGMLYGPCIITHGNDELIFLSADTFAEIKRIPFKNTGYVRCFAKDAANNIYVGCNKGIFKIDTAGNILQHLGKENSLPDECIYAMAFDEEGFLWCSTNKGILKINKDNSFQQLKKEDGLQENEFNTNTVAKGDDGEIFFGGVNGLSSFYPDDINSFEDRPNVLLTGLKINNEDYCINRAAWMLKKITLSHDKNSFSFDFIAMGANNPDQYVHQYKMEGIDEEWIQNNGAGAVRYFLQPGEYTLQLYASRRFDNKAKPFKEITIIIRPPFWKTWWFLAGLAGILLVALTYVVNQYNKRKYEKKLMIQESEYKLQLERERISRDLHDSIGAYANAILYKTELLEKEDEAKQRDELMKDLKFASKDIITALRETIWALKKDNYSAEDCLLRIRNFIQPFTRYYQHIQFRVKGEAPANKNLHYTKALNLVRIVQEAVTNAIKHTTAGSINITSREKDNRWELTVTDDGKGFDYETIKGEQQGNGLNNMRQRAMDSGFDLSITSGRDTGTKISIIV